MAGQAVRQGSRVRRRGRAVAVARRPAAGRVRAAGRASAAFGRGRSGRRRRCSGRGGSGGAGGRGGASGVSGAGGARPTVTASPGTTLIKVNTAVRHQTFEGWGTSLCWWANHVGGWSATGRDAVVDAVVDPANGLGFNIFRYNIGGGENPAHDHMGQWREMPGFQASDGTWDWTADANQRAVLQRIVDARRRGASSKRSRTRRPTG